MRYTILHVLCEGPTEERFVKDVLAPYLRQFAIHAKPVILLTSRKKNSRGGMLGYYQARRDLVLLRKQYRDNDNERHLFTTMFDYYALPDDFPGYEDSAEVQDVRLRVMLLEEKFAEDIGDAAFVPYIQLHEFESLLFADILRLQYDYPLSAKSIQKLKNETDAYCDPEMINDSPDTAPSKRIIKAVAADYHYNKVLSGAAVASAIGMETLMDRCLHFRQWIERIRLSAESEY